MYKAKPDQNTTGDASQLLSNIIPDIVQHSTSPPVSENVDTGQPCMIA
jgi:hypothetical protein